MRMGERTRESVTYGTVQDVVPLVTPLLDVVLEGVGIKRLEQLETAQQLRRNRHDGTPVVELAAVL